MNDIKDFLRNSLEQNDDYAGYNNYDDEDNIERHRDYDDDYDDDYDEDEEEDDDDEVFVR